MISYSVQIKEFAEKVVLLNARGEPRAVQGATTASSAAPAAAAKVVPKGPTITKPTESASSSAAPTKSSAKPSSDAAKV